MKETPKAEVKKDVHKAPDPVKDVHKAEVKKDVEVDPVKVEPAPGQKVEVEKSK